MTITELIHKLQQLRMESGDVNVLIHDENEGGMNIVQNAYLSYPDSEDDDESGPTGVVIR